jgi:hypothetical protein
MELFARAPDFAEQAERVFDLLMAAGAKADSASVSGSTVLMKAAELGADDMVARLLSAGADARLVDLKGNSALERAALRQRETSALMLLAVAPPLDEAGWSGLERLADGAMPKMSAALAARKEALGLEDSLGRHGAGDGAGAARSLRM